MRQDVTGFFTMLQGDPGTGCAGIQAPARGGVGIRAPARGGVGIQAPAWGGNYLG